MDTIADTWAIWLSSLTDGRGQILVGPKVVHEVPTNPGVSDLPHTPRTTPPQVSEGILWLRSHQRADGSWIDTANTVERDTTESILALEAYPEAAQNVSMAALWLESREMPDTDYLARAIVALRRSGNDFSALTSEMISRQNPDGGWGSKNGYMSNSIDTSLALEALAVVEYSEAGIIGQAIQYLLAKQSADYGWGGDDQGSAVVRRNE